MATADGVRDETPARRLTPRGEKRRAAIVEAATAVFLEHGFAGASLDMVIDRAGGSRRTLYEQFGGKEGLFEAVVRDLLDRIVERFSELHFHEGPAEEALVDAGVALATALTRPVPLAVFRMIIAEAQRFPQLGALFFQHGPERAYATLARFLAARHRELGLRPEDAPRAARHIVEMVKGELHLRALLCPDDPPDPGAIKDHVKQAVAIFLHGAAAASG